MDEFLIDHDFSTTSDQYFARRAKISCHKKSYRRDVIPGFFSERVTGVSYTF